MAAFLSSFLKPVAYVSLPLIALRSLPNGQYYSRTLIYVGTVSFVATLGAFYAAGLALVGRRFDVNHAVARTFYFFAGTFLDWRVEVEGEEWLQTAENGGARPAVIMLNHQSMVDLIPLGRLFPKRTSIMAKRSIQYTPLGAFMTMSGAIFIDRGNSAAALRSLDAAVNVMRNLQVSLWMYPEGTRHNSQHPDLLPFKKGGFHLAVQAGLPIIPIVVENYWHLYHSNVFKTGVIRVRVLPPIPTANLTSADVSALADRVRSEMVAALVEISTHAPPASTSDKPAPLPNPAAVSSVAAVLADVAHEHADPMPHDAVFEGKTPSRESLAGSAFEGVAGSENGTETEEEEGMVLVGRPT